jgi:hypothetical protein
MVLVRAVGVICEYNKKLEKVSYYPDPFAPPKLFIISDPFSEEEFQINSSLLRQKEEIALAIKCIEKFSPDILLLDGSVLPHSSDRPSKSSPLYNEYSETLERFKKLYSLSKICTIAGCVEDSRGRKFCEIVSERILSKVDSPKVEELKRILAGTRDTNLLYWVLDVGERTCVFRYGETLVTKDLGENGKNIYSFYIKTAKFDRPIRVDFYVENNVIATANKIASIVLALCCHDSYGFPAPLIEADLCAKLKENDVDAIHAELIDRVGITPSLLKLRREMRPF